MTTPTPLPLIPNDTPRLQARASGMFAALLLALMAPAALAQDADSAWKFSGDLRGGYFASERTARDGSQSDDDAFNARLRVALQRGFAGNWTFRTRAAGRFSSEQDGTDIYLRGYAPTNVGTEFGNVTLDEAYLGYSAPGDGMRVRIGRFQTGFAVPGVASKGLDRNDSPNIDVNWTDGVHLDLPVANDWRGHVIAQYRHRRGSGGVARSPLDFSDSDSRASLFLGLENNQRLGPVDHRMLSLTWMPSSLADQGTANASREDYLAIDARVAGTWPIRDDGLRLVAGAEVGYALNTPASAVLGTGQRGDSDGLAWQLQASLYDIAPGHHLGVAYGRAGAGWLISPDFRPNDALAEIRYQWRVNPKLSFEARIRERKEIEIPASARRARVDDDFYLRASIKF
ncbi:MAG TPA: hypothetical protein VFS82_04040 [Lysobacter sp.]|nr:hypothetical protein [Lysobacter sp.]